MDTHCVLSPGLAAFRAPRRLAHSRLVIILSCYDDEDDDDSGGDGGDGGGDTPALIPTSSLRHQVPAPSWTSWLVHLLQASVIQEGLHPSLA